MIKKCLKFSASWCGPCRAYAPIFHNVSEDEKYKNIEFKEIDVEKCEDEENEIIIKNNIRGVPTTLILDENNETVDKIVGLVSEDSLRQHIDNCLEQKDGEQE